jgi:hypothetical protein
MPHQLAAAHGKLSLALVGASQHFHHPFIRLLVRFEAIDSFGCPAMLEGTMKFHGGGLQLHAGLQTIGRFGAATDESINFFFQINKRLFHGTATIGPRPEQSKLVKQCSALFGTLVWRRTARRFCKKSVELSRINMEINDLHKHCLG